MSKRITITATTKTKIKSNSNRKAAIGKLGHENKKRINSGGLIGHIN